MAIQLKVDFKFIAENLSGAEYMLFDIMKGAKGYDIQSVTEGTNRVQRDLAAYTLQQKGICELQGTILRPNDFGEIVYRIIESDIKLKSNLISRALTVVLEGEVPFENEVGPNLKVALEIKRN